MRARWESVAPVPTTSQSSAPPSRMAPATSSRSGSSLATFHFFRQSHEGTLRRLPRGITGRLAEHLRELVVREFHFDAPDDGASLRFREPGQGLLVPLHGLQRDSLVVWGRPVIDRLGIQGIWRRPARMFPELVTDSIHHGLAQIRSEGVFSLRLEAVYSLKRLEEGVLDKIVGVRDIACPAR